MKFIAHCNVKGKKQDRSVMIAFPYATSNEFILKKALIEMASEVCMCVCVCLCMVTYSHTSAVNPSIYLHANNYGCSLLCFD